MKTRIEALRRLQWWLDEAFRVPGTSIRVGWDPIIGLVPWAGDLLTALLSCAIVFQAHQMRLPRIVQLRMLMRFGSRKCNERYNTPVRLGMFCGFIP